MVHSFLFVNEMYVVGKSVIFEVSKVFTHGAKKYGKYNWKKGISQTRLLDAAMRHILWYLLGEDNDKEWGCNHLAHAIASLSMALDQHYFNPAEDDRYKLDKDLLDKWSGYIYERTDHGESED